VLVGVSFKFLARFYVSFGVEEVTPITGHRCCASLAGTVPQIWLYPQAESGFD